MGGVRSCGKGGPHVVWRQLGWGKGGFNTVEQVGGGGQPIHLLAVGGYPSTERLSCFMYCFKLLPFIY